ncbi:hypothetical protein KEM52_000885 [Ascosphaera acerosa]|nr:hypothetical protein KEM52_000885 [Ascosphaera acerosa]
MDYKGGRYEKGEDLKPTIIEEGGVTQVLSKDGATAEQIELPPTFWQKVKRHFRRFWWLHLIIFICCFLIIIFPVIYVGYPKIAQEGVDKSRLTVSKLVLSDPYYDQFHLELDQVITSHSMFKPKLYEFTANLSLPGRGSDRPFVIVNVPQSIARNNEPVIVDQHVDLPSVEEFTRYTTTVMQTESFDVIVTGKPKLQQGKLPKISVNYNQTVHMKGLNKLKGFKLLNMTMDMAGALGQQKENAKRDLSDILGSLGSLAGGLSGNSTGGGLSGLLGSFLGGSSNSSDDSSSSGSASSGLLQGLAGRALDINVPFSAVADIPNPTVMTLYLGNITTWPMIDRKPIGESVIHDVILRPGNNNRYNVTGTMNIGKALPALKGTSLNIQILSNESIWLGRNLTYFGDSLASNLLNYEIDLGSVLKNSLPGGLSGLSSLL